MLFFQFIQMYKNFNEMPPELETNYIVSLFSAVISVDEKTTCVVTQLWYSLGSLSYQRLYSHNVCAWKSHCFLICGILLNKMGFVLKFFRVISRTKLISGRVTRNDIWIMWLCYRHVLYVGISQADRNRKPPFGWESLSVPASFSPGKSK